LERVRERSQLGLENQKITVRKALILEGRLKDNAMRRTSPSPSPKIRRGDRKELVRQYVSAVRPQICLLRKEELLA
jgi:hypothetical protein